MYEAYIPVQKSSTQETQILSQSKSMLKKNKQRYWISDTNPTNKHLFPLTSRKTTIRKEKCTKFEVYGITQYWEWNKPWAKKSLWTSPS